MSSVFRVWERFKYSIRAPWFSSVNNIFRDEDRGCVYTNCRSELTPAWQPSLHACGGAPCRRGRLTRHACTGGGTGTSSAPVPGEPKRQHRSAHLRTERAAPTLWWHSQHRTGHARASHAKLREGVHGTHMK